MAIETCAPTTLAEVKQFASRMVQHLSVNALQTLANIYAMQRMMAELNQLSTENTHQRQEIARLNWYQPQQPRTNQPQEACSRCGGRCTSRLSCRAMGKTCHKCQRPNHFSIKCRRLVSVLGVSLEIETIQTTSITAVSLKIETIQTTSIIADRNWRLSAGATLAIQ